MTPAVSRVAHDPERGTYGDCLRACVASLLDRDAEQVPHFYQDGCDGDEGERRLRKYLAHVGYQPFFTAFDPSLTREELFEAMAQRNPDVHYLLHGQLSDGVDHVVVCKGGKQVHNPAWYPMPMTGPHSSGAWQIMVIVRA